MKKLAILLAALLVAAMCVSPACAVEEGEYPWRDWTVEVTQVETNPMFVPTQMGEDEYAVAVYATVAEELWKDEAQSADLYAEAWLADADGNAYAPAGLMTGTDKPFLIFLYCVPKTVEAEALVFVPGAEVEEAGAAEEAAEAGEAVIPEELIGTWQGTGTPKNDGSPIDLVVTIRADGTGEYIFDQAGYHENNPISISYEGNSFTVNTDESILGGCEGTWALEDGVLVLDITSTLPSGRTYSYIAECTKAAEGEPAAEEPAAEEPAAAEESPAGKGGPEEGISWGMSMDEVKAVRAAQQKRPGGMHLGDDTLGGRPVLFVTVLQEMEDGEPAISSYIFDTESGGLIFAYYSYVQSIAETWKMLTAEYNAAYTAGDSSDIPKLYSLMAEMVPEDDFSGYLPMTTVINSWKDENGAGIWTACAPNDGILMSFRACPELTESVQ